MTSSNINDQAIVIGGSIAGLLSARVLADRFASVTIIETDKLPDLPKARIGVPQSVQPHILFTKGYRILGELFPNIEEQLRAGGAIAIDWTREFNYFSRRGWNATSSSPSDLNSVSCSRPLLEWSIRQQLANYANIHFVDEHRVIALLSHSKTRITKVALRSATGDRQELPASLVVDASGRRSAAPSWLQKLGFTPPPETMSWMLATGSDLRFATTQGGSRPVKSGGFFTSYTERLLNLTTSDPKMNALWMEVAHLLKSPLAFYHPQIAFKVLTKKD